MGTRFRQWSKGLGPEQRHCLCHLSLVLTVSLILNTSYVTFEKLVRTAFFVEDAIWGDKLEPVRSNVQYHFHLYVCIHQVDNTTKVILDGFETKHVTGYFPV